MHLIFIATITLFFITTAQAQSYPCSCSCCFGRGCQPTLLAGSVQAQQCSDASCLAACKARFYQCTAPSTDGQAIGKCLTATTTTTTSSPMLGGPYSCRCNCCNTGSYQCIPTAVGLTNAYTCDVAACSIACSKQYPSVCVNNQNGQTQGTCLGTSMSTPTIPSGSVRCGCTCTGSSGMQSYEMVSSNGCSSCASLCPTIQLQCYSHQNVYCF